MGVCDMKELCLVRRWQQKNIYIFRTLIELIDRLKTT